MDTDKNEGYAGGNPLQAGPAKKKKKVAAKRQKKKAKAKARKPAKKAAAKKAKAKARKPAKKVKAVPERYLRLDMRLTETEKAKIVAKAKKLRRTITSIVLEAIEKVR